MPSWPLRSSTLPVRSVLSSIRATARLSAVRATARLHSYQLATYDKGDTFHHESAAGFIELFSALPTKVWAINRRQAKGDRVAPAPFQPIEARSGIRPRSRFSRRAHRRISRRVSKTHAVQHRFPKEKRGGSWHFGQVVSPRTSASSPSAPGASLPIDKALYARRHRADSKAHARMLGEQGVISKDDVALIERGLDNIKDRIEAGNFPFDINDEDIHMSIEKALIQDIGEAGARLHTGRSRTDQAHHRHPSVR